MDELEPGQEYYNRQADSRGGCSGTRGKLRKFAKKNPDHPAVRHWVETNSWRSPDAATLFCLIDLIKTMIISAVGDALKSIRHVYGLK